jgi:hypothetical protein
MILVPFMWQRLLCVTQAPTVSSPAPFLLNGVSSPKRCRPNAESDSPRIWSTTSKTPARPSRPKVLVSNTQPKSRRFRSTPVKPGSRSRASLAATGGVAGAASLSVCGGASSPAPSLVLWHGAMTTLAANSPVQKFVADRGHYLPLHWPAVCLHASQATKRWARASIFSTDRRPLGQAVVVGMPASRSTWATAMRISSSVKSEAVNSTDLLSGVLDLD